MSDGGSVVLDASALVALLTDSGPDGDWVARRLDGAGAAMAVAAPELALYESANVLRRLERAGSLDPSEAAMAHTDLLALPIEWWPYEPFATRSWELRSSVTVYDASYVALAELIGAPLLTLDRRLAAAHGPRCTISTPG